MEKEILLFTDTSTDEYVSIAKEYALSGTPGNSFTHCTTTYFNIKPKVIKRTSNPKVLLATFSCDSEQKI
jgi:hypothetical protein